MLELHVADRRLGDVLPRLLRLVRVVGDEVDPAYAEMVVGGRPSPPRTQLDVALRRRLDDSLALSRQFLRGCQWVTVVPAELAGRIEVAGLHAVTTLRHGGVLVQATAGPGELTDERRVALVEALRAVLPVAEKASER